MGVAERRARQKQALRDEILDAAREIFVNEGYDGVSMRRVAEQIEYSPTTIYLYFKDKSELMYEICQETFRKLRAELEAIQRQDDDPFVALRRGLFAYVEFGLKHPQDYIATFVMPHQHADPEDAQRYLSSESEGMKTFAFLANAVHAAVTAGRIHGDVNDVARALWAGIHGVTSLLIVQDKFPWGDKEAVIATTIDSLLEGLKARG